MIRVSATFTADPLGDYLRMWFERLALPARVELAPYNQVFQHLLHADDGHMAQAHGHSATKVILVRWQDLVANPSRATTEPDEWMSDVERVAQELIDALRSSSARAHTDHLLVIGPSEVPNVTAAERLTAMERELTRELEMFPGLAVIRADDINAIYPVDKWHDPVSEQFAHVPYTEEYFAALATMVVRRIVGIRNRPRKVIVLDCDNTLWGGVCGEVGPEGVCVDGPYRALQQFMVRQHEQGMLLCLCSKNVESDVLEVFKQRDMPLGLSHLVTWRVNWASKAENIEALGRELSLGLDSFVFLDDDPVQCATVEAALPEVLTLRIPEDASRIPSFLTHIWALDHYKVTVEDASRTESYKQSLQRVELRKTVASFADFLENLDLRIQIGAASTKDVSRVAQLSQRTNQFNTTSRRWNESDVASLLESDADHCLVVRVQDRFGDYGIVGSVHALEHSDALVVDALMLSCRALGRGVEHKMLSYLGELAVERRLAQVSVAFLPSSRNQPALDFLESVTSDQRAEGEGARFVFRSETVARLRFEPQTASESPAGSAERPAAVKSSGVIWPAHDTLRWIANEMTSVRAVRDSMTSRTPRPDLPQPFVPPRSRNEHLVADIFGESLGLDRVGVQDEFTALGGKSIHLVRVHSLLLERLGVNLDITALFQHPTVASLVRALGDGGDGARMASVRQRASQQRRALARNRVAGSKRHV